MSEETPKNSHDPFIPEAEAPQTPQSQPAVGGPAAPKKGLLYTLFSPETRTGRTLRPILRWAGYFTGIFALGVLAAYLGLYQPMLGRAEAAEQYSSSLNAELLSTSAELEALKPQVQKLNDDLQRARDQLSLHKVLRSVAEAQLALATRDQASARVAVEKIGSDLSTLLPLVQSKAPGLADLLKSRLDLVKTELSRDPVTARMDLEKLYSSLIELQTSLQ